ncbi:ATP-binding cassette domain-containing protein [Enterococcus asini]|uniref:ATP-binding cassette domain-containing protein n=1 Tax=Enterococcus asini TaxID=57732 RepID=UPI0026DC0F45|nr:ABC transporter ATP-binding protein [Enterococcus asini]
MSLVEVKNVSYGKGRKQIVKDLNFQLEPGKIVALLGENGSGKTTIIRLLAGLALRWQGTITIAQEKVGTKTKAFVALLADINDFPVDFSIEQVVAFYENMYADFDLGKARQLLTFMELGEEEQLKNLSRGNREKLALLLTLSRKAQVYLLDEPLSGIDLLSREKIIQSLVRWFDEESLLVITTHQLSEIENLVDQVLILKEGTIALHADLESVREEEGIGLEELYRQTMLGERR